MDAYRLSFSATQATSPVDWSVLFVICVAKTRGVFFAVYSTDGSLKHISRPHMSMPLPTCCNTNLPYLFENLQRACTVYGIFFWSTRSEKHSIWVRYRTYLPLRAPTCSWPYFVSSFYPILSAGQTMCRRSSGTFSFLAGLIPYWKLYICPLPVTLSLIVQYLYFPTLQFLA